jgi:hypothetical protein
MSVDSIMSEPNQQAPRAASALSNENDGISSGQPPPIVSAEASQRPTQRSYSEHQNHADAAGFAGPFPRNAFTAGVIWIVVGSALILVALAFVLGIKHSPSSVEYGLSFVSAFAGMTLTMTGVQTVAGTARSTVGSGTGSIVLGVLLGLLAVAKDCDVIANFERILGSQQRIIFEFGGAFLMTAIAAGLLIAGILGTRGGTNYDRWRRARRALTKAGERTRGGTP